ncbi:MAG TPA: pyridoxal-phosphate dependent enzyme [Vicinamibacterales bacterium]|nr:pyridoxal-phosphate dependent enzyme [Vicinamibacterales bacterium]
MDVPGRAINLEAVREAATRIYSVAVRTPLIRLDPIDRRAPEIFLKLEIFQPIGSFKLRGAANAIAKLPASALAEGVWTVSAGNAAQGVALAAREAGARASVLVMDTAPATKIANIERLGATIHRATHDECWKAVEEHASSRMTGRFVHPFDDDDFICGNGTAALEILEDVPDVDCVIAALGGGGLLSGIGCVMRALRPTAKVYAAEPETAAPLAASLAAGHPVRLEDWKASFVDGAGGRSVLPSMWPLLKQAVDASVVVSLSDVATAMRLAAERCHIIAEGAGGCAIAAALSPQVRAAGHKRIVAVVSGGNIDLPRFASLVTE